MDGLPVIGKPPPGTVISLRPGSTKSLHEYGVSPVPRGLGVVQKAQFEFADKSVFLACFDEGAWWYLQWPDHARALFLPPGTVVKRGPTWEYRDQAAPDELGEVQRSTDVWHVVHWAVSGETQSYRWGNGGDAYGTFWMDIAPVEWPKIEAKAPQVAGVTRSRILGPPPVGTEVVTPPQWRGTHLRVRGVIESVDAKYYAARESRKAALDWSGPMVKVRWDRGDGPRDLLAYPRDVVCLTLPAGTIVIDEQHRTGVVVPGKGQRFGVEWDDGSKPTEHTWDPPRIDLRVERWPVVETPAPPPEKVVDGGFAKLVTPVPAAPPPIVIPSTTCRGVAEAAVERERGRG